MCTAIWIETGNGFFGRTLDYECSFQEELRLTPRNMPLAFRYLAPIEAHYGFLGMATGKTAYPLYYDGMNEKGLAMAGLRFHQSAVYQPKSPNKKNVAPFELIPYVLSQCQSVKEVCALLADVSLVQEDFSKELPAAPLHFMVADRERCVVIEPLKEGLVISDNPVGVMTNEPPLSVCMLMLGQYAHLSFLPSPVKEPYSRGGGAFGLPGDNTSLSRFVRAAFWREGVKETPATAKEMFYLLQTVQQLKGCVKSGEKQDIYTRYTACLDLKRGIYFYTTHENPSPTKVSLWENLEGTRAVTYPLRMDFSG